MIIQNLASYYAAFGRQRYEQYFQLTASSCLLIGFDTDGLLPPVWKGGESEALARLERHLERKAWVASFGRPKMTPQSLLASQTGLSPYLRFGCLSTRLFYYQLTDLYKKVCTAIDFSYSSHPFTRKV
jgi:deoxyribodipyrimidine photolyase